MIKKKVESRERQPRPSSCVACGKEAVGYNYGAPSCNSCKTFFRRTVTTGNERVLRGCMMFGVCAKEGDAFRQCRACRYEKCIKGGMTTSLIIKGLRKSLEQEDETNESDHSQPSCSNSSADSSPSDAIIRKTSVIVATGNCAGFIKQKHDQALTRSRNSSPQILQNPFNVECKVEKFVQNLFVIEEAHQKMRISIYAPPIDGGLTMDEFIEGPSKLGQHFEIMFSKHQEPFSTPLFPTEILVKMGRKRDFIGFDYSKRKLWMFHDSIYSVEYIKALPIYSLLSSTSKRVLISSSIACSQFTAAFYSYVNKSDRTCYPDGSTMMWTKQVEELSPNSTRLHTAIIAAMKMAEMDQREYALLKVIVVCNPMLNGLSSQDATLLLEERERCAKALLSYSLVRRGVQKGPDFFTKLLCIINLLTELTTWEKNQHILALSMGIYVNASPFAAACFHSS